MSLLPNYNLPRVGAEDEPQRILLNKILQNIHDNIGSGGSAVTAVTATAPLASSGGTTPNISLNPSGVTAGTYGDSTHVPQLHVTAEGLIDSVTNVAITGGGSSVSLGLYASRPSPTSGSVYQATDKPVLSIADASPSWFEFRLGYQVSDLKTRLLSYSPQSLYLCNETSGNFIDYGSAGINLVPGTNYSLSGGALARNPMNRMEPLDNYAHSSGVGTGAVGTGNPSGVSVPNGNVTTIALIRPDVTGGATQATLFTAGNNVSSSAWSSIIIGTGQSLGASYGSNGISFSSGVAVGSSGLVYGQVYLVHILNNTATKTMTLYINGIFYKAVTYSSAYSVTQTTPKVYISNDFTGTNGYAGTIGFCCILYGTLLSAANIALDAQACGLFGT